VSRVAALRASLRTGEARRWLPSGGACLSPTEGAGPAAADRPARILVVEDEHIVALGIESAILDAGMEVTGIAATAEEAIDLARADRPDIAVMDIRLAGRRDGVEAAIDLFNEFSVRCVFATAHHDPSTRQRAEPARPLAWVPKPYQGDVLVRAIRAGLAELGRASPTA
jgi:DNA-binding NarL/FixJ family response regulator